MSEIKGEFTGTWIPAHIMLDQSLNGSSKILYATIASFKKCYMSNETLGELIGTTPRNVQKLLKPLRDKGYIKQVAFNGKTRTLVPCRDEQMDVADTNKSSPNITSNNTKSINTLTSDMSKKMAKHLAECITNRHPALAPRVRQTSLKWDLPIDKLNRIDGYSWENIQRHIDWVFEEDDFWYKVILSGDNLRKNFAKIVAKAGILVADEASYDLKKMEANKQKMREVEYA